VKRLILKMSPLVVTNKQIRTKTVPKRNGEIVSLDGLKTSSYEEIIREIEKKIGKKPPLPKDLAKGNWTSQSLNVLRERYLKRSQKNKIIETPEEMCWRVGWAIASAEARWSKKRNDVKNLAKTFYKLLVSKKFLPNSPTLMNAGTGNGLQYSGCYVIPVEDSLESIFDAVKYQALVHQSGGGTGFSFTRLRPSGSVVRSSGGVASGPISFMKVFDSVTDQIKQGGRRRGANMGILRVDHPDILKFIHCKEQGEITNFNISVAITDKFMEAYERNKNYDLIDPRTNKVVDNLPARKIFDEIAEAAWRTGDPGIIFIDRQNKGTSNPVPILGPIESTNPCGEQPLYPYDSCNLGSIFLNFFTKTVNGEKQIDWQGLKKTVRLAVRFLDNVIEVNPYPLVRIRQTVFAIRRIGLGIGGWADMLIDLGIPYDSEKALSLGEEVMATIQKEAVKASQLLAKERGPFPLWPISIYKNKTPRRNSTVTTIAPTGSISIIAGASSGIEPIFAVAYQHIVKQKSLNRTLTFINRSFEKQAQELGFLSAELKKEIIDRGIIRDLELIPQTIREVFGTAHEIHQNWHIRMQAVFQKYTENAVSKTINMRTEKTIEAIKKAYLLAWETGCKGITVFRDGCKDSQVLNLGVQEEKTETKIVKEKPFVRPFKVSGATYKIETPVGSVYVTVNQTENNQPFEVFINAGKAGSDITAMAEALGRVISKSLKFGASLNSRDRAEIITHQLSGIGGRKSVGFGSNKVRSLPDAIALALSKHFDFKINGNGNHFKEETQSRNQNLKMTTDICPSCGASSLIYEEGCIKCFGCGYSEC
jgi:ribonucleoside-diphosphate reductase alpha chain